MKNKLKTQSTTSRNLIIKSKTRFNKITAIVTALIMVISISTVCVNAECLKGSEYTENDFYKLYSCNGNSCNAGDFENEVENCSGNSCETKESANCKMQSLIESLLKNVLNGVNKGINNQDSSNLSDFLKSIIGKAATTNDGEEKPDNSQSNSTTEPDNNIPAINSNIINDVYVLINDIRVQNNLPKFDYNEDLANVAQEKSNDMSKNGYFSHNSPTYGTPFEMMNTFGITYRAAGENIAMGYKTAADVVNAWMNSEGHRANILNSQFTSIGMGYNSNGNYWTQMFIG